MSAQQKPIQQEANEHYRSRFETIADLLEAYDTDGATSDDAYEQLQEMPLSFEKVTTHHRDETIEWEILLGTGGPADRVLVTTDFTGSIESATYQYQDWFKPWTPAINQDSALVERFAQIVGYYESE